MTSARNSGRALAVGLLAAVVVAILLGWLASEMLEGDTRAFDESVRNAVHGHAAAPLTAAMRAFTFLGSAVALWPLVAVAAALFWRAGWKREAALLAAAMLGSIAIEWSLKLGFHRARPAPFFNLAAPSSYSFPSGHALYALCFYGTLSALMAPHLRRTAQRALLWAAAIALIVAIGFSRIYLGAHYPSDVLAGYAAGFVWTMAVAAAFSRGRGVAR